MTCVHPLGHKGLPFPVGGSSLRNANVGCLVFDTTPQTTQHDGKLVLSVAMLDKSGPDTTKSLALQCLYIHSKKVDRPQSWVAEFPKASD